MLRRYPKCLLPLRMPRFGEVWTGFQSGPSRRQHVEFFAIRLRENS